MAVAMAAAAKDPGSPAEGRRRVVILGAGFAGLAACDVIARAGKATSPGLDIVVVDRHTYNTFQPLLYQVATAGLNPGDIAYPVRSYLRTHRDVEFRQATVDGVDFAAREVLFEGGQAPLGYDYLVIATGAATNFFGVPGAAEHGRAIYTMEDAIVVRDQISAALEHAASFGAPRGELTTVLVGGGPTGVEMAGTLAELRNVELTTTYRAIEQSASRIVLVERLDRLLSGFDDELAAYALRALESRGVEVRLSTAVREVAADRVVLDDGEVVPCGIVVWSAGVRAGDFADRLGMAQHKDGRIEVTSELRLVAHEEVFVIGDIAAVSSLGSDGEPKMLPQLAQPAIQQGRHAGRQILRLEAGEPLEAFSYKDKGIMATIGRRAAVTELPNGLKLRGTLAWLAWLSLHIVFLLGFRNRVAVLVNWAWRYIWWRRGTRVVAGS
ncbi:MAG: NAD(P)/FAD-dependent oxidoreductase [Acidimicrobiales bacterium]